MFQPKKNQPAVNRRKKQATQYSMCSNEEKILNASSKEDVFMNVCDAFEDVLNKLNIVSRDQKIYEKLCVIQNLIQLKTSHLQSNDSSEVFKNFSLSSSLRSSMQSLCSEGSYSYLDDDLNFKDFLKQVNCPFCEKPQSDKIKLISHLDENCRPIANKAFAEKGKHLSYSVFQILPNNSIKCNVCKNSVYSNLKTYFLHIKSETHKANYKEIRTKKQFTDYFFCSCCKVLIPNNHTEFEFHINLEIHKSRRTLSFNKEAYLKKGIHCVYMRSKNFNCIECNMKFGTLMEILDHMEDISHLKETQRKKSGVGLIFCELCLTAVMAFEVVKHFSSTKHKMAEKNDSNGNFEGCFYCGFTCDKLSKLASHMETNCNNINKLRKIIMKTNSDENNFQTVKPKKEKDIEESSKPEQKNYIIVKDNTELPELYSYFKDIGEIDSIGIYKKRNTIIHFKERTSVNDVLLLSEVNKINGVKVEITTEKEKEKEKKKEGNKKKEREVVIEKYNEKSDSNEESENTSCSESADSDPSNTICDEDILGEQLQQLFQRVSSHLGKNLHKLDPILKEKLLRDGRDTFRCQSFALIGFTGCELSFPHERISFYCDVSKLPYASHTINPDTFILNKGIAKLLFKEMTNALWEDFSLLCETPFPYIKCTHKETQTACTFTFMQSAKIVSDLLRHCIERNDVIKSFVLITRFWINVHKLGIGQHEFAIISLLISFLINEEIVEPSTELNSVPVVFHFCEALNAINKGVRFEEKSRSTDINAMVLFHSFLRFIYKFDFTKNVIYLPFKSPVPRALLKKAPISSLLANFETGESPSSSMCVIDPLLYVNLTSGVSVEDMEAFLDTIKITLSKGL